VITINYELKPYGGYAHTWITYYHPKASFYFLLICTFVFLKVVEVFVVFFEAQLCFLKKGVNFLSYTFVCLKVLEVYILFFKDTLFFLKGGACRVGASRYPDKKEPI